MSSNPSGRENTTRAFLTNLENSLQHLQTTCEVLREMETVIPSADTGALDTLLTQLRTHREFSAILAQERQPLIEKLTSDEQIRPKAENILAELPPAECSRASALFSQLRTEIQQLRKLQERAWTLLRVRSSVVNTTLSILTGGASHGYQSSGEATTTFSRPIMQHRC